MQYNAKNVELFMIMKSKICLEKIEFYVKCFLERDSSRVVNDFIKSTNFYKLKFEYNIIHLFL